jgi:hypothetical protein
MAAALAGLLLWRLLELHPELQSTCVAYPFSLTGLEMQLSCSDYRYVFKMQAFVNVIN